jgi:isovaleryl-CoA dehydrogenase
MTDLTRYGFTNEHQQLYDTVERYSREVLYPLCDKMDRDEWFPETEFRKLAELGLLGVTVPEKFGGAGMDEVAQAFVVEAMTRWNSSMAGSYAASDNLCVNNIYRNANDFIREKYLPGFCDGSYIGALGITEPGAGSDALGGMSAKAVRKGDSYVLNGRKMFITNGPCADVLLVYAKTAPELGAHGISAFIVEKDFPGFSVAQKLDKMGWRGSMTGELVFDNCVVPAENLVGQENNGVAITMSGLDLERVIVASHCLGVADRALELTVEYAKTRKQFNRAIGEFQLVQAMLADMYTDIETARCQTYQMLREISGLEVGGGGRGEVHMRAASCILHAARAAMRVVDNAVQIHGGMGYMMESEINRLYRVGKLMQIGAGTTEVRQLIIGGELIK